MRRITKTFVGVSARLMAASWLFQTLLPALCCCCCLCGNTTTAYGSDEMLPHSASCCCPALFGQSGVAGQRAVSHSVADCRGTICDTCESYGCLRGSDSRQSTLRRRQVEDSESPVAKLVLPSPCVASNCDSHWLSSTSANVCDKGTALSAAERCVSLQRLVL